MLCALHGARLRRRRRSAFDARALQRVRAAPQPLRARGREALARRGACPSGCCDRSTSGSRRLLLVAACAAWQPIGGDAVSTRAAWRALARTPPFNCWASGSSCCAVRRPRPARTGRHPAADSRRSSDVARRDGPYRLVRHPLYLGWMLVVFGAAHMTGDRLAFAVITTAYLRRRDSVGGTIARAPLRRRHTGAISGWCAGG